MNRSLAFDHISDLMAEIASETAHSAGITREIASTLFDTKHLQELGQNVELALLEFIHAIETAVLFHTSRVAPTSYMTELYEEMGSFELMRDLEETISDTSKRITETIATVDNDGAYALIAELVAIAQALNDFAQVTDESTCFLACHEYRDHLRHIYDFIVADLDGIRERHAKRSTQQRSTQQEQSSSTGHWARRLG